MANLVARTSSSITRKPSGVSLETLRIVEVDGVAYYAIGETVHPEAGRLVAGDVGVDLEMGAHDPDLPVARIYQMGGRGYALVPSV